MSVTEYFTKMRTLSFELASACKPIDENDFVTCVLTGLGDYENLVVSLLARPVQPTFDETYAKLMLSCLIMKVDQST